MPHRSSPGTRDTHICCEAFGNGTVTTCFNALGLARPWIVPWSRVCLGTTEVHPTGSNILNANVKITILIKQIGAIRAYNYFSHLSHTCGICYTCNKSMLYHTVLYQIHLVGTTFDTNPPFNTSVTLLSRSIDPFAF